MESKIIRPRNYFYEFLVFANGLALVGIWWIILRSVREAIMAGCVSYLILARVLRYGFQKHHRRGMKLVREKNYSAAAAAFQQSYEFFQKHPAVDKYRFITMFSSNAIPYQQMALNNMGLCYLHMEENIKALGAFKNLAALNMDFPNVTKVIEEIQKNIDKTA